jgi:hypothetical protein
MQLFFEMKSNGRFIDTIWIVYGRITKEQPRRKRNCITFLVYNLITSWHELYTTLKSKNAKDDTKLHI